MRTFILLILMLTIINLLASQHLTTFQTEEITFPSGTIHLAGTIYKPSDPIMGIVLVHGSGQEPRMSQLAEMLAHEQIAVLTYDKRGIAASGGVYVGPEVGTNNVDSTNLRVLAQDASSAIDIMHSHFPTLQLGLMGASQAGWIIPLAASLNQEVELMVLFSCLLVTAREQLRFQFYTDGRSDFWEHHTDADAREHTFSDPDRYEFTDTDPRETLRELSIPGLWIFGEQDIQVPVQICIDYLDVYQADRKPFEYISFPEMGHSTMYKKPAFDSALQWLQRMSHASYLRSN
ncbi:MAG: alpha/beta hydrolase [Bacteroidota bacterium]